MTVLRNKFIFGIAVFTVLVFFAAPLSAVFSYQIEQISNPEVMNDFVVGPGKIELEINPGETKVVNITVANRMGDTRIFNLTTEDFKGSDNVQDTVVLLGDERGPYSLKDYISVEEKSFELKHGERATIPVTVFVPADAEPGGLYGSLLTSTASKPGQTTGPSGAIVARVGTLFFVRIPGDVNEDGKLIEFKTKGGEKIFNSGPVTFSLLYENNGSVHVNPYGEIRLKNLLGKEVGFEKVDPWFAMPGSVRLREVTWDENGFLLGRYTAVASINRGYDNIIDTFEYSFWVIPVKLLVVVCIALAIFILAIRFVVTRFEIRKK